MYKGRLASRNLRVGSSQVFKEQLHRELPVFQSIFESLKGGSCPVVFREVLAVERIQVTEGL